MLRSRVTSPLVARADVLTLRPQSGSLSVSIHSCLSSLISTLSDHLRYEQVARRGSRLQHNFTSTDRSRGAVDRSNARACHRGRAIRARKIIIQMILFHHSLADICLSINLIFPSAYGDFHLVYIKSIV